MGVKPSEFYAVQSKGESLKKSEKFEKIVNQNLFSCLKLKLFHLKIRYVIRFKY